MAAAAAAKKAKKEKKKRWKENKIRRKATSGGKSAAPGQSGGSGYKRWAKPVALLLSAAAAVALGRGGVRPGPSPRGALGGPATGASPSVPAAGEAGVPTRDGGVARETTGVAPAGRRRDAGGNLFASGAGEDDPTPSDPPTTAGARSIDPEAAAPPPNERPRPSPDDTLVPSEVGAEGVSAWPSLAPTSVRLADVPCGNYDPQACGCASARWTDYRGTISVTVSGRTCQVWSSQTPHPHRFTEVGDHNYCRNPAGDPLGGWCYTTDEETRWERCNIPTCEEFMPSTLPSSSSRPTTSSRPSIVPSTSSQPIVSSRPSTTPAPTAPRACEGADAQTCGCGLVHQMDYRGSIHTTPSGECGPWNKGWIWPKDYPHAGLVENFCRNPLTLPAMSHAHGTWCWVGSGEVLSRGDWCDVPYCFPPSTLCSSPISHDDRPDVCKMAGCSFGCLDGHGAAHKWLPKDSWCRSHEGKFHPSEWDDVTNANGALETCKDQFPISCSTDGRMITALDELQVACAYNECITDHGYDSIDFVAPSRKEIVSLCSCPWEIWDCTFGSQVCIESSHVKDFNECCVRLAHETPENASCECVIKPKCVAGSAEECAMFAEQCCEEDDQMSRCEYLTQACRLSLEQDLEDKGYWNGLDDKGYCERARDACCGDDDTIGGCQCDFWDPLCTAYPKSTIYMFLPERIVNVSACAYATYDFYSDAEADTCCSTTHCLCDYYTHVQNLGVMKPVNVFSNKDRDSYCEEANNMELQSDESDHLRSIYNETHGDHWIINTGWLSGLNHCEWHGIVCADGHVVEISLKSNNVTGKFPANHLSKLYKLQSVDLSDNKISGSMAGTSKFSLVNDMALFFDLRELTHVDLSRNYLSGEADVLFAPALVQVNFSHNHFSSVNSYKEFKRSHKTLRVCDLSENSIQEEADKLVENLPPNMERLILSGNLIHGTLPSNMEGGTYLRELDMGTNMLTGELPDFSRSAPNLQVLDLSNQKHEKSNGLTGPLPEGLANVNFLRTLNLGGNSFTGAIPPGLDKLALLKTLDLSRNKLSGQIPANFERLGGVLEYLDLSYNTFKGRIPEEVSKLAEAKINLKGNTEFLCSETGYDMKDDPNLCPKERNALKDLYISAKGREWTEDGNWIDEYISCCEWAGVECDDGKVKAINLTSNGLSGKLSESIGELSSLEMLDLSDNDIKGHIPTTIGLLTKLKDLKLSYNSFIGRIPAEIENLKSIERLHLHGNRMVGSMVLKDLAQGLGESSFISDCGSPSFYVPVSCESCTMCCNKDGGCYQNKMPLLLRAQALVFKTYASFSVVLFFVVFALCCMLSMISYKRDLVSERESPVNQSPQARFVTSKSMSFFHKKSISQADHEHALRLLGNGSSYSFLLGTDKVGWLIALGSFALQIMLLLPFLRDAEVDLDNSRDLEYTWTCTPSSDTCVDLRSRTSHGWVMFALLMILYMSKDLFRGIRMIFMSGKIRHGKNKRLRYFVGGVVLCFVTAYIIYASVVYNRAIANSDAELVSNAIFILFISEIDDKIYELMDENHASWIARFTEQKSRTEQKQEEEVNNESIAKNESKGQEHIWQGKRDGEKEMENGEHEEEEERDKKYSW